MTEVVTLIVKIDRGTLHKEVIGVVTDLIESYKSVNSLINSLEKADYAEYESEVTFASYRTLYSWVIESVPIFPLPSQPISNNPSVEVTCDFRKTK